MNSVLIEIYSTILPSAPYIIAAYALLWVALLVYVGCIYKNIKSAQKQMEMLQNLIENKDA